MVMYKRRVNLCQYFRQKVERLCCCFKFRILLLRCHITNSTVYSFMLILASTQNGTTQYRYCHMIPITTKRIQDSSVGQVIFQYLTRKPAPKVAVQDVSLCIPDIQVRILFAQDCQFRCHRCVIGIFADLSVAQIHTGARQVHSSFFTWMQVMSVHHFGLIVSFPKSSFRICMLSSGLLP